MSNSYIITIWIIVICIISVAYSTFNMKYKIEEYENYHKMEQFGNYDNNRDYDYKEEVNKNYDSTLEDYKSGKDFMFDNDSILNKNYRNLIQYHDVKTNYPLHTLGCVKHSTKDDILNSLNSMFYVSYSEFYSMSINHIYENIANDLNLTISKLNNNLIDDPVYVLIFQAPDISFNNEQIVARHDVVNTLRPSYEQNKNVVRIGEKMLYTKLFVLYPAYFQESNKTLKKYTDNEGLKKFEKYFNSKKSRNKLCFMNCNGINNYSCGCLNREKSDNTLNFYKSRCTEYDDSNWDYGMVYNLNKFNDLFSNLIKRDKIFYL
jgi:hypothetical protein